MPGKTARAAHTWAIRFTSQMSCQSTSADSTPPNLMMPAFEQKRSISPYVDVVVCTSRTRSASTPTSTATASPPIVPATCSAPSLSRSATTMPRAPSAAKRRQRARPMPCAPPVTTMTLSFNCMCFRLSWFPDSFFSAPQLDLGDGLAVHLIRTVRQAQRPGMGPGGGEAEVGADARAAVRLDRAVDDAQGHVWRHDFDHGNLGPGGLVADGVHQVSRLQGQEPCLLDLDTRPGDVGTDRPLFGEQFAEGDTSLDSPAHCL